MKLKSKSSYPKYSNILLVFALFIFISNFSQAQQNTDLKDCETFPVFEIKGDSGWVYSYSFQIAMGDIFSNLRPYKGNMLATEKLCLIAGIDYMQPWTRDAAINVWNGAGLVFPSISKNTLVAQLQEVNGSPLITGQYWDKIIWSVGAWNYYLYTGDKQFLQLAFDATINTLKELRTNEFDSSLNLFRGAAVYGDGVAAYPIYYTTSEDSTKTGEFSGILDWIRYNPHRKYQQGEGLPMHALSTNAVYYEAYHLLPQMAKELGIKINPDWALEAGKLKDAINKNFWNDEKNYYRYLVDPTGNCDAQEGLGISFAMLFGIADKAQMDDIFKNTYVAPAGIPCVYPSFKRYINKEGTSVGRHSGAVWPHVEGFWAEAAAKYGDEKAFAYELKVLAKHAARDHQFVEIYHPVTGLQYGGEQEPRLQTWDLWDATNRQTWSATAYLRMILMGLAGMSFDVNGISFTPVIPFDNDGIELKNIRYRNAVLNIFIKGKGNKISSFKINGTDSQQPFLRADATGIQNISITVE